METRDVEHSGAPGGALSRRALLVGAAAIAAAQSVSAFAQSSDEGGSQRTILAYVGTYTPNGQGIYRFRVDPSTGALSDMTVFPSSVNPSWIAFAPGNKYLYASDEISNFNGTTNGAVSAYAVDPSTGDLTLLNTVSSQGSGPAHLSVDPSGKWVLVANYGGGSVAVLPVQADGSLGDATDVQDDSGACGAAACPVGPMHAQKASPGSFAISGHDAPHAHMIQTDPSGRYAISNDLGLERSSGASIG